MNADTPHPPATPEFGHVVPGAAPHVYPMASCMQVKKLSVGVLDNNVYLIHCTGTNESLVIDGAAEPERILSLVAGTTVVGIAQTHGHGDHVRALPALVDALGVPVFAHAGDSGRMPVPTRGLSGGDSLKVGEIEVEVVHTPGHTPGGLCYLARGHLFSGDTLFPGGPGNTSGDRAAFGQIMTSLDVLFSLPDDTRVSPGHGLDTSIGRERPHLETWRARGW